MGRFKIQHDQGTNTDMKLSIIHDNPFGEQKQELDRTFEDWKAESQQEQIDDVVVVGVRL